MVRSIEFNIDIKNKRYLIADAMQDDDIILTLNVDEGGQAKDLTGSIIQLDYCKGDNTVVSVTGSKYITIEKNVVTIICPRECAAASGESKCNVVICSEDKQVSSFPISINITANVLNKKGAQINLATMLQDLHEGNLTAQAIVDWIKEHEDILDIENNIKELKSGMDEIKNLKNYILKSHNGTKYKISVDDYGNVKSEIIKDNVLSDLIPNRLLIWNDEFDNETLDLSKWRYVHGKRQAGSINKQFYPEDQSKLIEIKNSILKMKCLRDNPIQGYEWSASFIETNNLAEFQYGRIEAKIKFDTTKGSYATFWTLGANYDRTYQLDSNGFSDETIGVEHPKCGEIDIAEYNSNTIDGVIHWGTDKEAGHKSEYAYNINSNDGLWHIYSIEWTENDILFYVDGALTGSFTISNANMDNNYNPFKNPQYIMFNSGRAIDSYAPESETNELYMEVDWVRVYAPEAESEITKEISLMLDKSNLKIETGTEYLLKSYFIPDNVVNKTLEWFSTKEDVASVYGGKITAKSPGTTIITAKTRNNKTASCILEVINTNEDEESIGIIKDGLICWLDSATNIDGTIFYDKIGDNNFNLLNGAEISEGIALFPINSYGKCTTNLLSTLPTNATIEVLYKITDSTKGIHTILQKENCEGGLWIGVDTRTSPYAVRAGFGNGDTGVDYTVNINKYEMQHSVKQGDEVSNYLNSIIIGDTLTAFPKTYGELQIGNNTNRSGIQCSLMGEIISIKIYNRVLTEEEIKTNYDVEMARL